jgi:hypothetical protein
MSRKRAIRIAALASLFLFAVAGFYLATREMTHFRVRNNDRGPLLDVVVTCPGYRRAVARIEPSESRKFLVPKASLAGLAIRYRGADGIVRHVPIGSGLPRRPEDKVLGMLDSKSWDAGINLARVGSTVWGWDTPRRSAVEFVQHLDFAVRAAFTFR